MRPGSDRILMIDLLHHLSAQFLEQQMVSNGRRFIPDTADFLLIITVFFSSIEQQKLFFIINDTMTC